MRALTQDTLRTTSSVELVGIALADHAVFKHVCAELQRRDVDARAAAIVVDAYRLGSAPPWLAAYMLGCARAPLGYEVAREILLAAPGLLAESYAGPAMARIAGARFRATLSDCGRRGSSRKHPKRSLSRKEIC